MTSYLTARPARGMVAAGHQQSTCDWWEMASDRFELVASELVRQEGGARDPDAVRARLSVLPPLASLDATAEAEESAETLSRTGAVLANPMRDAAHIAVAADNGVEYLVTWNFGDLANLVTRALIEPACRQAGLHPPVVCTPEELMEDIDNDKWPNRC